VILFTLVVAVGFGTWWYQRASERRIPRVRAGLAELAAREARETGDYELELLAYRLSEPLEDHLEFLWDGGAPWPEWDLDQVLDHPLACVLALSVARRPEQVDVLLDDPASHPALLREARRAWLQGAGQDRGPAAVRRGRAAGVRPPSAETADGVRPRHRVRGPRGWRWSPDRIGGIGSHPAS
jgi:hypothetical protein